MNRVIVVSVLLILFSCGKDDSIDFDEKRNNIIGDWEVTQVTQEIRADTVYHEGSFAFPISFYQDGTGIKNSLLDIEVPFEWLYQFNPEKVVTTGLQQGIILANTQIYDISKNEIDRQIWEYEVVLQNSVADSFKHTWKMDRK